MRRAGATAAACAALAISAIAAPTAAAAPANIIAGNAGLDVFNPTTYSHDAGTVASMTISTGSHNVTASANGPDGEPLFRGATISSGSTPVNGTQFLQLGSYPFRCTIHSGMNGTLNVDAGTPLARPAVELAVKSKSLKQALKKSEVKVKVTITGGGSAKVDLKLGKKKIGSKTATQSGVLKIPLTSKGEAALEKKSKATVTASASIDFGAPASAKGKLK